MDDPVHDHDESQPLLGTRPGAENTLTAAAIVAATDDEAETITVVATETAATAAPPPKVELLTWCRLFVFFFATVVAGGIIPGKGEEEVAYDVAYRRTNSIPLCSCWFLLLGAIKRNESNFSPFLSFFLSFVHVPSHSHSIVCVVCYYFTCTTIY